MQRFQLFALVFIGIINITIAAIHSAHDQNIITWTSFAAILLATVVIILAAVRIQNGLSNLGESIDRKKISQLQSTALASALIANTAISSALTFFR
jgi:hypothetical protein